MVDVQTSYAPGQVRSATGLSKFVLHEWDQKGILSPEKRGGRGFGKPNYRSYAFEELIALQAASDLKNLGVPPARSKPILDYIRALPGLQGRERLPDGRRRVFFEDLPHFLVTDGSTVWKIEDPSQLAEHAEEGPAKSVLRIPVWSLLAVALIAMYTYDLDTDGKLRKLMEIAKDKDDPKAGVAYFAKFAERTLKWLFDEGSTPETRRWLNLSDRQGQKAKHAIQRARFEYAKVKYSAD